MPNNAWKGRYLEGRYPRHGGHLAGRNAGVSARCERIADWHVRWADTPSTGFESS